MQTPHTSADAEIVYSVGSDCTNLSTQESMPDYSFSQSAHSHFCIRCNVYSGPVVIDSADTDIYVAAAAISQKLPGLLCIRESRRQSYATA